MDEKVRAALDAIAKLYSSPSRMRPGAFVRHDTFTGKAYVDPPPLLGIGLQVPGYDSATFKRLYEASLRAAGLWPDDWPPVSPRKRWRRRGWHVVIGRRR